VLTSSEAAHAVLSLLAKLLCPYSDLRGLTVVQKDGERLELRQQPCFTLGFLFNTADAESTKCTDYVCLSFPTVLKPEAVRNDPVTLILGPSTTPQSVPASAGPAWSPDR
jgi:hypothetical protein